MLEDKVMMKKDIEKKLSEMQNKVVQMNNIVEKMDDKKKELNEPRGIMSTLKIIFS